MSPALRTLAGLSALVAAAALLQGESGMSARVECLLAQLSSEAATARSINGEEISKLVDYLHEGIYTALTAP